MLRTPSEVAKIFQVDRDRVKAWAYHFKAFLSHEANPPAGEMRQFRDEDLPVLAYIYYHWEENPDLESITCGLNRGDHLDYPFEEVLYQHSKIFQEPPDGLDETWSHGFLLLGSKVGDPLSVARCYRLAAEEMIEAALRSNLAHQYDYSILYLCRHTLELYLKLLGPGRRPRGKAGWSHSLENGMRQVERVQGGKIGRLFRAWIEEFDRLDEGGTAFRYEDGSQNLCYVEYWIDLRQLRYAMDKLCSAFEEVFWRRGSQTGANRAEETEPQATPNSAARAGC
jgi:hypothetical protein